MITNTCANPTHVALVKKQISLSVYTLLFFANTGMDETFDYFQELARSAFADMLHDSERNRKYSLALKEAIDSTKAQGKPANVLDVGTGSGLLAMLAAKHNAQSVVTIETFSPVSVFARKIIEQNGFKDQIQLINRHSTEVKVGASEEMKQKANILVAEVLDTELIGEGAIKTYNEAHKHLLEENCISVPHKANVYVQLVKSSLAAAWFEFKELKIDESRIIKAPNEVKTCRGLPSINDIQLSQFPLNQFSSLTDPIKICEFNFSSNKTIPTDESFVFSFQSAEDTDSVVAFFWWDLDMNVSGSIRLSCAPHWLHPDQIEFENEVERRNSVPWRDHWMQGCYFIPEKLDKGGQYMLSASHDEFSWFFDIKDESKELSVERPICTCCFHMTNSRNQIMQINDDVKRCAFIELLHNAEFDNALFVGDHSLVPLIAAHVSKTKRITIYQEDELSYKSIRNFIEVNNLTHRISLISDLTHVRDISHLIGDPYFNGSILPIENISRLLSIIRDLCKLNQHPFKVYPQRVRLCAVPTHFINLYKIRWPLQSSCEGFNHECFDDVIELASKIADDNIEPFSLWEYPCYALGKPSNIIDIDFNDQNESSTISQLKNIEIDNFSMCCNGITIWMEWMLGGDDIIISTGPSSEIVSGELINWKFDRQVVHLIPHKDIMSGTLKSIDVEFHLKDEIAFDFAYHYYNNK